MRNTRPWMTGIVVIFMLHGIAQIADAELAPRSLWDWQYKPAADRWPMLITEMFWTPYPDEPRDLVKGTPTIQLFANCMDWAKHFRRKAATKGHMLLDARTLLPRFAVVKTANSHDACVGRRLCNRLREGEIVAFDKA